MDIDFNGPTALIFDVSEIMDTLDRGGEISPLAWQYVIERDLVEKGHLTIVSTVPKCESLAKQYQLIYSLKDRYSINFADQLSPHILAYLADYVVETMVTSEVMVIIKRKLIVGSHPCKS